MKIGGVGFNTINCMVDRLVIGPTKNVLVGKTRQVMGNTSEQRVQFFNMDGPGDLGRGPGTLSIRSESGVTPADSGGGIGEELMMMSRDNRRKVGAERAEGTTW